MLVDKSMPTVAALYDAILCSRGGRQRGTRKTSLFDTAYGLPCRIPLTKLVELDGEICLYLKALMVALLLQAGEL